LNSDIIEKIATRKERGGKMDVKEAIEKRNSIRKYEDRPVPEEKLLTVLEAARLAPSGRNCQDWKFIVVRDGERIQELGRLAGGQYHVHTAPVIIAAVATDPEELMPCGVQASPVNLAIAIDHITLEAMDEGLGTCWIGAFAQEEVKKLLGVPDKMSIISLLTLGFPGESGRPKSRKKLEDIVCYETYQG
jgi:nitroreductase